MNKIAGGIYPTMITPYTEDGRVDYDAAERIVNWYVQRGCDGIFAVCQSSEMFNLSLKERVQLAKTVSDAGKGRIDVIASGHISDDPEAQIDELGAISETGVKAVVMVTNRMAKADEDDSVWMRNTETLMNALPGVTFGLYECPAPYKRLMNAELLNWCVRSRRFAFMKDTCCNAPEIAKRIAAIQKAADESGCEPMGLYNANSMTLLESLRAGAAGFSGVMANLHPELYVWLYKNWREQPEKAEQLQGAITLLSSLEDRGYPICAKKHMQDIGVNMTLVTRSRPQKDFGYAAQETLHQAEQVESLLRTLYDIEI